MTGRGIMALTRRGLLALLPAGLVAGVVRARPAQRPRQCLWYRAPASAWTEALPVGNGRIGAMIFGGIGQERLQLNEDSFWSGAPYDPVNPQALGAMAELRRRIFAGDIAGAEALADAKVMAQPLSQAAYQTLGSLLIEMSGAKGDPTGYERSLDLDTGLAETLFTIAGVTYRRRVVASPVNQVIAVHLSASRGGMINCRLSWDQVGADWSVDATAGDTLRLSGRNGDHGPIKGALRFDMQCKAVCPGGQVARDGEGLVVSGGDEMTLLIAMATSYKRFDDVSGDPAAVTAAQITAAQTQSFAQIAAQARDEHRRLFRRVSIDLGTSAAAELPTDERVRRSGAGDDPALAALYFDYGRYLLIASSRPGSQPANLQGIWNDSASPPWGSKYTININTQMNYWPAETTALPECVEPLIQMVREMAVTGARTARTMYGARGWVAHHNVDLWRATAPIDGAQFGLWPMGGAWLCGHLWDHYEYRPDAAYLVSIYPLLKGAALFFLDTLQVDPRTGHLVTNPSMSPENPHGHGGTLDYAPTMDMQILADLFDATVAAAGLLDGDKPFADEVVAARARLLPMQVGRQGQLQEWPQDWDADAPDQQHRHVSHLYGLYPSRLIDVDRTPDLARAARRSLEIRGDKATGWATAWRINLWARLREGNRAHGILNFLLGPERTYPNLFDAHPPFQIDGNFGGTAGIVEMLVQNYGDHIHLLPALPDAWPNGSVAGLRTRGDCTIDLAWQDGVLQSARLRAPPKTMRTVRWGATVRQVEIGAEGAITLSPSSFR